MADADQAPMKKVASASFVGAFLEWYDFNLYAVAAPLVFNTLFFPSGDELIGTLAAFVTFGVGFVFRPIGGIVFGHFGDRIGRKAVLVATLLTIGLSTFLIGLLPSYASIGVWAPILLAVLRMAQGFGLGGEFGGAATLIVEYAPRGRRGFWGSLPQAGGPAGFLLGTVLLGILHGSMPEEAFLSWGWRIPFLLSIVLLVAGLIIRLKILETPVFQRMKADRQDSKFPLRDLLRSHPKNIVFATIARLAEAGSSQVFLVFVTAYLTSQLDMHDDVPVTGIIIFNGLAILLVPFYGYLSDRVGLRRTYLGGLVLLALYVFPYFWLLESQSPALIWIAFGAAAFVHTMMASVEMPFLSELVGTSVRFSGLSVIYQASAIVAGFLPALFTGLLALSGGSAWPIAAIMIGITVLAIGCTAGLSTVDEEDPLEAPANEEDPAR